MFSSCAIFIIDPLERLIDYVKYRQQIPLWNCLKSRSLLQQLEIRKGSFLYYLWEKPPLPVVMQVYIFNITNAEAFLNGTDKKLKVVEVGPYVYQ